MMFSTFGYKSLLKVAFLWTAVVDAACLPGSPCPSPTSSGYCGRITATTNTPTPTACATPPTPTVGLLYGDFECGLGSWTVDIPDPAATASVATLNANTGSKSFEVVLNAPPISPQLGVSARITSQPVPVTPGTTYTLEFFTFFNNLGAGFIGVMVNGNPIYTIDAEDKGAEAWHENTVSWTAAAGVTTAAIRFEFLFGEGSSVDQIDTITFGPT